MATLADRANEIIRSHAFDAYNKIVKIGWVKEENGYVSHFPNTDDVAYEIIRGFHHQAVKVLNQHGIKATHTFGKIGSRLHIDYVERNKDMCESLISTISANVDNANMSDKEFRQFIRNSLPVTEV